jgi:transposase
MTLNRILKLALNLKGVIVENADFSQNQNDELELTIHTRISKKSRDRCPFCGRKCNIHDYISNETFWRCMDFGPTAVRIAAKVPRICIRIAYGFRNIDTLISFVMLFCSQIKIPWPRNNVQPAKIKAQNPLCH